MLLSQFVELILADHNNITLVNKDDFFIEYSKINKKDLLKLVDEIEINEYSKKMWCNIILVLNETDITDEVFDYLYKNKIAMIELGHKKLDKIKLKKLIPYCEEALFTYLKIVFCYSFYSEEEFAIEFIKYISDNLINQLLFSKPSSDTKLYIMLYSAIKNKNNLSPETYNKINDIILSKRLKVTCDQTEIEAAYKKENYIYNLGISQNIFANKEILKELTQTKNMKFSKQIKNNANYTLKIKRILS